MSTTWQSTTCPVAAQRGDARTHALVGIMTAQELRFRNAHPALITPDR